MGSHEGFTLVELAIVLVVVGLLAGGVMVGRDLIQAAEIRAAVSQMDQLNAAVNTFRLKFNCLPGDCRNATAFLADAPPAIVHNGNGDGYIEGYLSGNPQSPFTVDQNSGWDACFWQGCGLGAEWINGYEQMAMAGLYPLAPFDSTTSIPGPSATPGVHFPLLKFQSAGNVGGIPTFPNGLGYGYMPGYLYLKPGHKLFLSPSMGGIYAGLDPQDARAFDAKIDDGRPFGGKAVAMNVGYIYRIDPGNLGYCADDATNTYRFAPVPGYMRMCALAIDADF